MRERSSFTFGGKVFSAVSNILSVLSYIGITGSVLMSVITRNWYFSLFVLIGITILLGIKFCQRYHVQLIKFGLRLFATNNKYKYLSHTATYEYKNEQEMYFATEYEVKALQTDVDHVRVRCKWSGPASEELSPKPIKRGDFVSRSVEQVKDEYGFKCYKLCFLSCNRGDPSVKVGLKIANLRDPGKTASPHLGVNINVITDLLTLKVVLPDNLHPNNVVFFEYIHATDDHHWHKFGTEDENTKLTYEEAEKKWVIQWTVKKPIVGGKYIIRWDF